MADRRIVRAAPLAVCLLLPLPFLLGALESGRVLAGDDMLQGSFHIRELVGRTLLSGRLPTWDSHSMCGFPLLAALQSAALYPLTWPCVVLGPGAFWAFTVWAHMALAGLFAYGWMREGLGVGRWAALAGALVFELSGFFVTHMQAGHISQISAFPWLAAVAWRTEVYVRAPGARRGALLGAAVALLFLTGFPQFTMVAFLLVAVRAIWHLVRERTGPELPWKPALSAAAWAGLGLLLAAPQLLPALELVPQTQRLSVNKYEYVTSQSLPPENLVTFLAPAFFGRHHPGAYWGREFLWEICGFTGAAALILAGIALSGGHRQRWLWAGVAVAALLLALGRHSPLFRIYYTLVPGADFFRAPGRYLAVFTLAVAGLTALGFARLEEEVRSVSARASIAAAAVAGALLLALAVFQFSGGADSGLWKEILQGVRPEKWDDELVASLGGANRYPSQTYAGARGSLVWAAVALLATAGILAAHATGRIKGMPAAGGVALVAAAELIGFAAPYFRSIPADFIHWPREVVAALQARSAEPVRLATTSDRINPIDVGKAQAAGIDHVGGYEAMMLGRYAEIMNFVENVPPTAARGSIAAMRPHPVYAMLGVRYWLMKESEPIPPGLTEVFRWKSMSIREWPAALPRAYVVPRAVVIPEIDKRLQHLRGSFDPKGTVVLEEPVQAPEGEAGSARIVSRSPGAYTIEAESGRGGFLVLSETQYPGWTATIDDRPAEIVRANHFVMAVRLPPGRHVLRFAYGSSALGWGWVMAATAALLAGLLIARERRQGS